MTRYHIRKTGGDIIEVARIIAGTFFLLIIIANVLAARYGYETFSKVNPAEKFTEIQTNPGRFNTAFLLIIIEHLCLIGLAISMFFAFNQFNLALAITWLVSRSAEGMIQIYYKFDYRKMLTLSQQYSSAGETEKDTIVQSGLKILITKNTVFCATQVLFSVGTMAYSLVFILYDVFPLFIGWFGVASAMIYGTGSALKLTKDTQAVWNVGGLMILVYELVLGGWLIIETIMTS